MFFLTPFPYRSLPRPLGQSSIGWFEGSSCNAPPKELFPSSRLPASRSHGPLEFASLFIAQQSDSVEERVMGEQANLMRIF